MDDDNESVDSTEGLPVRHVVIDEDPDEDTPRTSEEPVNAYNAVKCAECAALRDNAHRAWEMVASYADKAHRLIELENQNHMLGQINDEQHTYVGEQARQLKEMKARLNEVDELRRDTEDRMRLLQSQYEQVLQKANEGRKHMEAANEWREKYDSSQKLLLEVDALRKSYFEKYKSSVQIAADFSDKNTKAVKDMHKLQESNAKMNAELTLFRRHFPRVFAVAKELRQCAAANPAVLTKVFKKADKVLEDIIVQSLTLKKRPTQAVTEASAAAADEASEAIATTSEPEFSDEDAAAEEIESLLQNNKGPASAADAPSTSANAQPSHSRNHREVSSVPQTSTSGSSAQDDNIGLARVFEDLLSTDSAQTARKARVAHTPKKTQRAKDQEKSETGTSYLTPSALQPPERSTTPMAVLPATAIESPSKQSKRARKAPLFDAHKTPAKQPPNSQPPPAPTVLEQTLPTTSRYDDYADGVEPGDFTSDDDSSPEKTPVHVMVQQSMPTADVVPREADVQPTPPSQSSSWPVSKERAAATGVASAEETPATHTAGSTAEAATVNEPQQQSTATSAKKTEAVPSAAVSAPKPSGPLPDPGEVGQSSTGVPAEAGRKPSIEAILKSPFFREFEAQPLISALEPNIFSFEQGESASSGHQPSQEPTTASDNVLDHLMESIDAVASVPSTQARSRSLPRSNQAADTAPHTEASGSEQQASAAMPPPKRVAKVAGPQRRAAASRKDAGSRQAQPRHAFQGVMTESEDEALFNILKAAGEPMRDLDLSFMEKPKKKTPVKKPPGGKPPAKKPASSAPPARCTGKQPTVNAKTAATPLTPPLPLEERYNLPKAQPQQRHGRTLLGKLLTQAKASSRSSSSSSLPNADPDQPSSSGIGASAAVQQQSQPSTSGERPTVVPQRKSLCKGTPTDTVQKQPSTSGIGASATVQQQSQPSTSGESLTGVPQRKSLCKGTPTDTVQKASQSTAADARRATVGVKRTMGSASSTASASQPDVKRAKLIDLPTLSRKQVFKLRLGGKKADTVTKTRPETAAAARRAEVGSANSIVLSHFQQAAQRNQTKPVYERVCELMKSFEAKMAETPELGALSVEILAGLMVRATIDMDVGDLWQSAKLAALAGTASYDTALSKNEKVVIDFAHQLSGFDPWSNLMGAYFRKMSLEVSKALPSSSATLKAMHFRSLTFTYLLMENEAEDSPEKKADADKAYPTLCALVQLLVQNQPPSIAVPILCYVATIHPEFFRKAVVVKANEDTAFRRILRLQLSDMTDKIPVVNKVIVGALGLQPAVNHPFVASPTSRELETWAIEEIDRALQITDPFPKDALGGRQVSRAVLGALRPITAFLSPHFKPALDRAVLMRQQFARLFTCLEDPHTATVVFATLEALPERSRKLGILATLLARALVALLNNSKTAEKAFLHAEILPDVQQKLVDYAARYKSAVATKPEFELLVAGLDDALTALSRL